MSRNYNQIFNTITGNKNSLIDTELLSCNGNKNFPIIVPSIKYDTFICDEILSPTYHFNKTIKVEEYVTQGDGKVSKEQQINWLHQIQAKEIMMSGDYFVVYHAYGRAQWMVYELITVLYNKLKGNDGVRNQLLRIDDEPNTVIKFYEHLEKNIEIETDRYNKVAKHNEETKNDEKLRQNDVSVYVDGEKKCTNINDIINNKNDAGLDYWSFFKVAGISVNLSAFGGKLNSGESTYSYFKNSRSNTAADFMFDVLLYRMLLKIFNDDGKTENIAKFFKNKCDEFKILYNNLYGTNGCTIYPYCSGAKLLQIFIHKEIVDDVLYISTPYGNPLGLNTKQTLKNLRTGKIEDIKKDIINKVNDVKNSGKDFCDRLKILNNNTLARITEHKLTEDITNLQARFIAPSMLKYNDESNKIVINQLDNNNIDDTEHRLLIISFAVSLCYEYQQLTENDDDSCVVS